MCSWEARKKEEKKTNSRYLGSAAEALRLDELTDELYRLARGAALLVVLEDRVDGLDALSPVIRRRRSFPISTGRAKVQKSGRLGYLSSALLEAR
jgi:hypothetical protein